MPKILVIDDSPVERLMVKSLLGSQIVDAKVCLFDNAEAALEAIQSEPWDVVVTDLQLDGMSGLQLIQELRSNGVEIPVILMTGYGSESVAVEAIQAGATSYVPKSGLNKYLVRTIKSVIGIAQKKVSHRRLLGTLFHQDLRFCIENDSSLVNPFIDFLHEHIVSATRLSNADCMQVYLALAEALTNAINHGNLELNSDLRQEDERVYYDLGERRRSQLPYSSRRVYLSVTITADEVDFRIRDEGPGFDPKAVMQRLDEASVDRIGGRGLMLIHSCMDTLDFNETGNEIRFSKRATVVEPLVSTASVSCRPGLTSNNSSFVK